MEIGRFFEVGGAILAPKKYYYDDQKSLSEPVRRHFDRLDSEERKFFGSPELPKKPTFLAMSDHPSINDPDFIDWAKKLQPDIIFLFGTEILRRSWLEAFPEKIVNLHLGVSPFYRGSGTLFWPFFHNEIHFVGTTVHITAAKVDAGGILAHVLPDLEVGDDFYSINMKAIAKGIAFTPRLGLEYLRGSRIPAPQEHATGRLCRKAEFTEAALSRALSMLPSGGLNKEAISQINHSRTLYKFRD